MSGNRDLSGIFGASLLIATFVQGCSGPKFTAVDDDDGQTTVADSGSAFEALSMLDPACGIDGGQTDDACSACLLAQCGSEYAACFGDQFIGGQAGGACIDLATCALGCECGDSACFQACQDDAQATAPAACTDCLAALRACAGEVCSDSCEDETPELDDDAGADAGHTDPDAGGSDPATGDGGSGTDPGDGGRS